jgi:hypothetical protein
MISDFESLMPLKERIERNAYKNEYFKDNFEESNKFDKKQKLKGCCFFKKPVFEYL